MTFICNVCGNTSPQTSKYKPKIYCSQQCSNYNKFKEALEANILLLSPTPEARKLIRGDMFRLCNLISKSTNTLSSQNKG